MAHVRSDEDLPGGWSCRAAKAWWLDTTDVVILNSPWLRRDTGRGFRCLWISMHIVSWFDAFSEKRIFVYANNDAGIFLSGLLLTVMVVSFVKVLWSSLTTSREVLSNSLLLCSGTLTSYACWNTVVDPELRHDLWLPLTEAFFTTEFVGHTFPILCHCNVHPVALLVVVACTAVYTVIKVKQMFEQDFGPRGEYFTLASLLHTLCFLCCISGAFTLDFTNRVRETATTNMPLRLDSWHSPLAGRSARTYCWLAGVNNWIFAALLFLCAYLSELSQGWLLIFDTLSVCIPWVAFIFGRCSQGLQPFAADLALAIFCFAVPLWSMFRPNLQPALYNYENENRFALLSFHIFDASAATTSVGFATQILIQAGCLPSICLSVVALALSIFVTTSIRCHACWAAAWDYRFVVPIIVSLAP